MFYFNKLTAVFLVIITKKRFIVYARNICKEQA